MIEKDPRAVSSDQTSTAQEPKKATASGDNPKNNMGRIASPILRCCIPEGETYTEQPINQKACEIEQCARAWAVANAPVWSRWVSAVRNAAESGVRWSIKLLAESARDYDIVNGNGEPFKVNNNLTPALARILCEEVEGAGDCVELRTSIFESARDERMSERVLNG